MTAASESDLLQLVPAELHRVLSSPQFNTSDRNRRFLEYVVDETLAGRSDRIKAYSVATVVFGRGARFDAQRDPIVRMEASRLRRALERFYLTDGRYSAVRIVMPKGAYVPEFHDNVLASRAGAPEALAGAEPSIEVECFEVEGDRKFRPDFGAGFARDATVALMHYPEFNVLRHPGEKFLNRPEEATPAGCPAYLLTGGIAIRRDALDISAILVETHSDRVVWGKHFHRERGDDDLLEVRAALAGSLVRGLLEPFGVIFNDIARRSAKKEAAALSQVELMVRYHEYRRAFAREQFAGIRSSLEQAVIANPRNATAFACLSQMYVDGYRFGFARAEPPSVLLARAREFARHAVEMDPLSSRGHHALGVVHWFHLDTCESIRALRAGLECNPHSGELLADLALFQCLRADWEGALGTLERVFEAPLPVPPSCHLSLSLWHFTNSRFEEALLAARKIDTPHVTHGYVAEAISLIRLQRKQEARQVVGRILKVNPNFVPSNALSDLAGGNMDPSLSESIAAALAETGSRYVLGEGVGAH